MQYCKSGNFAGVYTCMRNEVYLEERDEENKNRTALICVSQLGFLTIVDLLLDF